MTFLLADASFTGLLDTYQNAINGAYGNLAANVNWLLWAMITFNIVMASFQWMFSDDNVAPQLVRKLLFIGFFVWLVSNWAMLTNALMSTMMMLGLKAADTPVSTNAPSPEHILGYGYYSFFELLNQMSKLASGWTGALTNLPTILVLAAAAITILGAFLVIAIQMAVALLFFKLGSLAVLVLLPFGMLNQTAFIAERPLGWVMASGVRVLVLTLVCSIGFNVFDQLKITPQNASIELAINVAIQSILLMVIAICANRLAGDLMSGGPTLGAGNVASAAAGAALAGGVMAKVGLQAGASAGVHAIRAAATAGGKTAEYGRAMGGGGLAGVGRQVRGDVASVAGSVGQAVSAVAAGRSGSPWATASAGGPAAAPPTVRLARGGVEVSTPALAAAGRAASGAASRLGASGGGGGGLSPRLGDGN